MLHWANKDQYYTKSGESFSNYAFTLENGKKVQFRLVEADTAKDNRKDNEQARVFALIEPQIKTEMDENGDEIQTDILPFDIQGDLLTLRFEYKAVNKKEKQSDYITQAVGKIQNFAIPDEFQGIFKAMPTEKNRNRTLLEKYLTDYTAKNTADYFIHKNLGKFLNQELDFYIKNEVMNLDNIQDSTDFSHIEQNLQTIKTIKTVAKEIIAFLAQLEDFQKKLWLKKKFVAGCHYLITLDHLNEAQVQAALDNPKQTAQWQALFNVNTSALNAAELCKNYPHLVVDTALFEPTFQADVLREIEHLDEKTNGLLIHSDNFQALNLLQERYKEQVKCIYIDPPYNTAASEIIYKNSYKHSSWNTLMSNRIEISKNLLSNNGIYCLAIDDEEFANLRIISEQYLPKKLGFAVIRSNPVGRKTTGRLTPVHEYTLFYGNSELSMLQSIPDEEKGIKRYPFVDEVGRYSWLNFIRTGSNDLRTDSPTMYYPIIVTSDDKIRIGKMEYISDAQGYKLLEPLKPGEEIIFPNKIDGNGQIVEKNWQRGWKRVSEEYQEYRVRRKDGVINIDFKARMDDSAPPRTWWEHSKYASSNYGALELKNLFETSPFSFPKSLFLVSDCLWTAGLNDNQALAIDYFAGSGTTAHAVINLNREDNGNRKYILVEQGEYFDSVLKPRVQKVIFAKDWKDGKPQADNGAFGGVSQIVKVLKLESYEDTLNNLELRKPAQDLADMGLSETVQNDYLLHYMLDVESRDSLLNTQHFTKPFDYQLNIATTSAGAYEAKTIDLVETFNYLIGLRVSEINDKRENGLVTVQGINTSGEKTLVIWRDCEKYDYDRLNDYLNRHKINPQESEFDVVYINGDHNVPTVFAGSDESIKTLKVRSIEAEFLQRMFE